MRLPVLSFVAVSQVCSLLAVLAVSLSAPAPGGFVAVVFPPWRPAAAAVGALALAGARILRPGGTDWVWVVQSPDAGFYRRVRAAGALFSMNPLIAGGCTVRQAGGATHEPRT